MGGGSLKDMDGGPNSAGSKVSDFNKSGSWRRRQGVENEEGLFSTPTEQRLCYCGLKLVCLTSRTKENPGRRFYTCPMPRREQQCGFFRWLEATDNSRLGLRLGNIERKLRALKLYLCVLMGACLTCILLLVVHMLGGINEM
ncbi:Zinc finger, GRF-type [Sesbania bispinosa]|nr:Zinc finger, GRF-type [Sesbania bispinosa]